MQYSWRKNESITDLKASETKNDLETVNFRTGLLLGLFLFLLLSLPGYASENPLINISMNESAAVNVTNSTFVQISETSYMKITNGAYESVYGRLHVMMTPWRIENGEKIYDMAEYLGSGFNQLLYCDESGEIRLKTSFYNSVLKEHIIDYSGTSEGFGYDYDIFLTDWQTPEYDSDNNFIGYHTELASNSSVDINYDSYGNLVIDVNGEPTIYIPILDMTDGSGQRYILNWQLDKNEKTITFGGLDSVQNTPLPRTYDPSQIITNGGFETGDLTGWTQEGVQGSGDYWRVGTIYSEFRPNSGSYFCYKMSSGSTSEIPYHDIYLIWDYTASSISSNLTYVSSFLFFTDVSSLSVYIDSNLLRTCLNTDGWSFPNPAPYTSYSDNIFSYTGNHRIKFRAYENVPGMGRGAIDSVSLMGSGLPDPPVTDFTAIPQFGHAPLTVQFNDTSSGSPTSYFWDFGDGNTSTERNPVHTYYVPGYATVKHSSTNAGGTDWENKTWYIQVSDVPSCYFDASPLTGNAPLAVSFNGSVSTGMVEQEVYWDFGDGNTTSGTLYPTHTYYEKGPKTVSLRYDYDGGTCYMNKSGYIFVNPVDSFYYGLTGSIAFNYGNIHQTISDTQTGSEVKYLQNVTHVRYNLFTVDGGGDPGAKVFLYLYNVDSGESKLFGSYLCGGSYVDSISYVGDLTGNYSLRAVIEGSNDRIDTTSGHADTSFYWQSSYTLTNVRFGSGNVFGTVDIHPYPNNVFKKESTGSFYVTINDGLSESYDVAAYAQSGSTYTQILGTSYMNNASAPGSKKFDIIIPSGSYNNVYITVSFQGKLIGSKNVAIVRDPNKYFHFSPSYVAKGDPTTLYWNLKGYGIPSNHSHALIDDIYIMGNRTTQLSVYGLLASYLENSNSFSVSGATTNNWHFAEYNWGSGTTPVVVACSLRGNSVPSGDLLYGSPDPLYDEASLMIYNSTEDLPEPPDVYNPHPPDDKDDPIDPDDDDDPNNDDGDNDGDDEGGDGDDNGDDDGDDPYDPYDPDDLPEPPNPPDDGDNDGGDGGSGGNNTIPEPPGPIIVPTEGGSNVTHVDKGYLTGYYNSVNSSVSGLFAPFHGFAAYIAKPFNDVASSFATVNSTLNSADLGDSKATASSLGGGLKSVIPLYLRILGDIIICLGIVNMILRGSNEA